jgi:hypothetical protein
MSRRRFDRPMRWAPALDEVLSLTNESNWRDQLNRLREEEGSWEKVARSLGVSPATLRRYRAGDYSAGQGRRRALSPAKLIPKISDVLRTSRKAMIRNIDFRTLRMFGTWRLTFTGSGGVRRQQMDAGQYMSNQDVANVVGGYVAGNREAQEAIDEYLAMGYSGMQFPDAHLISVEELEVW